MYCFWVCVLNIFSEFVYGDCSCLVGWIGVIFLKVELYWCIGGGKYVFFDGCLKWNLVWGSW